ncbi:MAG: DUF5658 family protein [Thermoproteaceae archaeon]|nr:DUF5658 family protein [Thermoproteaceae archaeon]
MGALAAFALMALASLADAITTYAVLLAGGVELNPALARLNSNPSAVWPALALWLALAAVASLAYAALDRYCRSRCPRAPRAALAAIAAAALARLAVAVHNALQLLRLP